MSLPLALFLASCWCSVGADGRAALIPPPTAMLVWTAGHHHDADPYELAAWMVAENKGRRYDPATVGRHGAGGELGLLQLRSVWARELTRRCSHSRRYYRDLPDCLWVEPGKRVRFVASKREHRKGRAHLARASVNVEAAAVAMRYVKRWVSIYSPGTDWRAVLRCSPDAWRYDSPGCRGSVKRVVRWEQALRRITVPAPGS